MSVIAKYEALIAAGDINDDPLQRQILLPLETLTNTLVLAQKSWFPWRRKQAIQGVYIVGPVGAGKTFLMDLFYDCLPLVEKKRFHFHHFMQEVDEQLRHLQGTKNPLTVIAKSLASTTRVLCFDEFMVNDVAYAMILAELLQAILNQGVVLVATSNTLPDNLYLKGVQRARFLPAIAAIKSHCQVLNLEEQQDYRLGREPKIDTYITPLGNYASEHMINQFECLAPVSETGTLTVQRREVPCIKHAESVVWFDFKVICNLPRSQLDYLDIANRFDTIFVSDIPALGEKDTIFAILLMHFVDVMYDRGIRLILSAEVPIEALYVKGELSQSFKRTTSRLQEMQSVDYLKRHPKRAVLHLT